MAASPPTPMSIDIDGYPLAPDELLVEHLTYEDALGRMFEMHLDLLSPRADLDLDAVVGARVSVEIAVAGQAPRLLNGHVSQFVQAGHEGGLHGYRATVVPWLWFLTLTSDARIFNNQKIPDIINTVLGEESTSNFDMQVSPLYVPVEYCVQYRETDFQFVSRLMERAGIYYYFTHTASDHKMVLTDSGADPAADKGGLPHRDGRAAGLDKHLWSWTHHRRVRPGKMAVNSYDFTAPRTNLKASGDAVAAEMLSAREMYEHSARHTDLTEGERQAKMRTEEWHVRQTVATAMTNTTTLHTGDFFELSEHARADLQGRKYRVAASRFEHSSRGSGNLPGMSSVEQVRTSLARMRPSLLDSAFAAARGHRLNEPLEPALAWPHKAIGGWPPAAAAASAAFAGTAPAGAPMAADRPSRGGGHHPTRPPPPAPQSPSPATPTTPSMPSMPSMPSVPSMPSMPSMPNMPSPPTTPSMPSMPAVPATAAATLGGKPFECELLLIPHAIKFRPERTTPRPIISGPQTAVVGGDPGYVGPTDEYGRVKVTFHWDRAPAAGNHSTCWVRVSQNWAGKNYGAMFLPHGGQEVIVEFLEGDPDKPIITGRLYNRDNMPPLELPNHKNETVVARDGAGNELILDSTSGSPSVRLYSPGDSSWYEDGNSHSVTLGTSSEITVGAKASLTAGLEASAMVGAKIDASLASDSSLFVGAKVEASLAATTSWTFGTSWEVTKGIHVEAYESSSTSHSKLSNVIGSETETRMVTGVGPGPTTIVQSTPFNLLLAAGAGTALPDTTVPQSMPIWASLAGTAAGLAVGGAAALAAASINSPGKHVASVTGQSEDWNKDACMYGAIGLGVTAVAALVAVGGLSIPLMLQKEMVPSKGVIDPKSSIELRPASVNVVSGPPGTASRVLVTPAFVKLDSPGGILINGGSVVVWP